MPDMYVIQRVRWLHPVRLAIVDQEAHSGWQPIRLDGAQVDTEDVGFRIFVAHCTG